MLNPELEKLFETIKTQKTICLLAPSFPVDFKFPDILIDLRKLWFDKIVELTFAAKLINMQYRDLFKKDPSKQWICTNCPTIINYIKAKHPKHKDKLINIASPMVIMSRFVKKEYWDDYKTIFVWPCFAKKMEAKISWDVDYAITFQELQTIFDYKKSNNIPDQKYDETNITQAWDPDFDKFYNDYTKVYPLPWAVAQTMNCKWIIKDDQILIVDEIKNIDEAIQKMESDPNIKFFDPLACIGGCLWWPWMISKASTAEKEKKLIDYKEYCKKDKIGSKLGKFKHSNWLDYTNNLLK